MQTRNLDTKYVDDIQNFQFLYRTSNIHYIHVQNDNECRKQSKRNAFGGTIYHTSSNTTVPDCVELGVLD